MTQAPQATATMTQRGSPVAVIGHLCLEFGFDTLADRSIQDLGSPEVLSSLEDNILRKDSCFLND